MASSASVVYNTDTGRPADSHNDAQDLPNRFSTLSCPWPAQVRSRDFTALQFFYSIRNYERQLTSLKR